MAFGIQPPGPNKGSLARDQLANERTFLAWVRTAIAVIGLGVLMGKLVDIEGTIAQVAGLVMVLVGVAVLGYAQWRYERVTALLGNEQFAPAHAGPMILTALGLVVGLAAAVLLLT